MITQQTAEKINKAQDRLNHIDVLEDNKGYSDFFVPELQREMDRLEVEILTGVYPPEEREAIRNKRLGMVFAMEIPIEARKRANKVVPNQ